MTLKIISAEKIEWEGEVSLVTLPGALGSFQVLNNHAALISQLVEGNLEWETAAGSRQSQKILGGVADIKQNEVSVCLY